MLASFPASMLNQKPSDLGILNRFKLDPSRSSRVDGESTAQALGGVDTYRIHKTIAARVMTAR
jgi:hypothetical protein